MNFVVTYKCGLLVCLLGACILAGCASINTDHDAAASGNRLEAVYQCENGQRIRAHYFPPDRAQVTIGQRTIKMHIARSADGARYVGGNRVWWTKGSGSGSSGTLFKRRPNTNITGKRITTCVQR